jgi:hypothetical protein
LEEDGTGFEKECDHQLVEASVTLNESVIASWL